LSQRRSRPSANNQTSSTISSPATQRAQRQVTINLKNGAPVVGNYISADANAIYVDVAGNRLTIKLDDVTTAQFSPSANQQTLPPAGEGTATGQAQLSLEAGLVFRSGDTKPVARVTFHLLDNELGKILADAGLQPDPDYQRIFNDTNRALISTYASSIKYASLPKFQSFGSLAATALNPHILQSVTTDFSGKSTFTPIATGTYYVMGYSETPRGYAIWNVRVDLKSGLNTITLDQNNAADAR
jgi:hypothetical protein